MLAIIICNEEEEFRPLTDKPLALFRMAGKTLLERKLDMLWKIGITSAMIVTSQSDFFIKEWLENYLKADGMGRNITIECDKLNNEPDDDDAVVVTDLSWVENLSLDEIVKEHIISKNDVTALVGERSYQNGEICISEKDNIVLSVCENPDKTHCDFSLALYNFFITKYINVKSICLTENERNMQSFTSDILKSYRVGIYRIQKDFNRISTIDDYIAYQVKILYRIKKKIISETDNNFGGATILPPAYIGKNVIIETGVIIEGGSVIDDNAVISMGSRINSSYVGSNAVIGKNCTLNKAVVCSGAVLMERSALDENSAVGENTVVGENTLVCEKIIVSKNRSCSANLKVSDSNFSGNRKGLSFDEEGVCCLYNGQICPESYLRLGQAVGSSLKKGDTVVIGCSCGNVAEIMTSVLLSGLVSSGVKVLAIGKCTQPQLFFCSNRLSSALAIYVGTDTNFNVRITARGGLPVEYKLEKAIVRCYNQTRFRVETAHSYSVPVDCGGEKYMYEQFLIKHLPTSFHGFNVAVITNDTIVDELSEKLLKPRNDINGERIVFHLSPDPQKLSAYSDKTGNVSWERLCTLACKIAFQQGIAVSLPYCFPSCADVVAEHEGGRLYRYHTVPVDDSDMEQRAFAMSSDNLFVRDGLILCAMIVNYLTEKSLSFSQALEDIEKVYTVERYVVYNADTSKLIEKISGDNDAGEGTAVKSSNARAIIRPLKNGNGLMIFAESVNCEYASAFCDDLTEKIKKYESGCDVF